MECSSCRIKITNQDGAVNFKCPKCGKFEMVRCETCRKTVAKYTCPECGFTGQN